MAATDVVAIAPQQRRRRGPTLIPTTLILTLIWLSLPSAAKLIIRQSLAKRLMQLASFIGGPDFNYLSSSNSRSIPPKQQRQQTSRSLPPTGGPNQQQTPRVPIPLQSSPSRAPQPQSQSQDTIPVGSFPHRSYRATPDPDDPEAYDEEDYYDADLTNSTISNATLTNASTTTTGAPAAPPAQKPEVSAIPNLPVKHRSHRHTQAGDRALNLLFALESLEGWEFQQERSGIKIHTRPVDGLSIPIVRGDGLIDGDWTTQEVFSVIRSSNCRKHWDPRYDTGESIEHFNVDEALSYSVQKGTFPVAPRDLVTALFCKREPVDQGGRLYYYVTSVTDPTAPSEGRGRVRAEVALAGWVLRPVPGKGLEASYIVQVDPKGSVPTALVKLVQVQTPLCIFEVSRYLAKNGPIPFIVRDLDTQLGPGPDVVLMQEEYDDRTSRYELDLTIRSAPPLSDGRRGVFAVSLPKNTFGFGADIGVTVSPAGAAEVRSRLVMGGERAGGVVIPEELRGIVSYATGAVVEVWIDGGDGEEVEVEVRVEPGRHGVVLNGEPVEPKKD
ncbi:hypothetical protein HDU97_008908 [Phlyctochytrium planicorne]|nr:hypothetical protein HDU97_008908 [Phlyctochytrium planicorne]